MVSEAEKRKAIENKRFDDFIEGKVDFAIPNADGSLSFIHANPNEEDADPLKLIEDEKQREYRIGHLDALIQKDMLDAKTYMKRGEELDVPDEKAKEPFIDLKPILTDPILLASLDKSEVDALAEQVQVNIYLSYFEPSERALALIAWNKSRPRPKTLSPSELLAAVMPIVNEKVEKAREEGIRTGTGKKYAEILEILAKAESKPRTPTNQPRQNESTATSSPTTPGTDQLKPEDAARAKRSAFANVLSAKLVSYAREAEKLKASQPPGTESKAPLMQIVTSVAGEPQIHPTNDPPWKVRAALLKTRGKRVYLFRLSEFIMILDELIRAVQRGELDKEMDLDPDDVLVRRIFRFGKELKTDFE